MLNRISSENKELSDRVLEVVKIKMEETGNWNVEKELLNFLPIIYNERAYQPLKAFEDVSASELHEESKKLFATINEIKNNILRLAEEGNRCIKNLSDQSNDFHYGKNGIFGWFEKIIASDGKNVKVGANITKAIEEKGAFTKNGMDVQSGDFEKLSSLVYTIIEESNKLNSQLNISKNLKLLLLLVDLKKIMDRLRCVITYFISAKRMLKSLIILKMKRPLIYLKNWEIDMVIFSLMSFRTLPKCNGKTYYLS